MAHHHREMNLTAENLELPPEAANVGRTALTVGVMFLGASFLLGILKGDPGRLQQMMHSYLTSFAFYLTMTLGALFFVMVQHLARSHWSVSMRRVAEFLAC